MDVNLAYMILSKMISSTKTGYMPYGLLLTQVFDHFNVPPFFHVSNDRHVRVVLPFPELNENVPVNVNVNMPAVGPVALHVENNVIVCLL